MVFVVQKIKLALLEEVLKKFQISSESVRKELNRAKTHASAHAMIDTKIT